MNIKPINQLPDNFSALIDESKVEGFNFLEKMHIEWTTGKNRFDKNGECVFAAFDGERLIGIGGLNRDPYLQNAQAGRVRHLYVLREFRNKGAGKLILNAIIEESRQHFKILRLRTDTENAARFYEAMGFRRVTHESATHELEV